MVSMCLFINDVVLDVHKTDNLEVELNTTEQRIGYARDQLIAMILTAPSDYEEAQERLRELDTTLEWLEELMVTRRRIEHAIDMPETIKEDYTFYGVSKPENPNV